MAVFMSTSKILQAHSTERNTIITTDKIIAVLFIPMPLLYSLCLGMYCIWRRSRRVRSATERLRAFFSRPKSYQQLEQFLPHLVLYFTCASMDEAWYAWSEKLVVLNQHIQRLGELIGLLVCDQSRDFESSEYWLVPGKRPMYRSHDTPAVHYTINIFWVKGCFNSTRYTFVRWLWGDAWCSCNITQSIHFLSQGLLQVHFH